ncbi:nucleotide sugar dehydrogenase [Falsarthrobacter nasiphocae]|uniref:Nucleotide sugar dehydrogenase n=1 Tax=Falsarthrobacter nasiphocae TaxID=189863 RepID=A0AAE3YGW7_9MICC|nr:nucleotide sugar dehydrogenase [Falsarthrobacter nasiphocae]MDR6891586.1 nucleotide sugar dehydrogenase [Falsarthrobacter nasiphocae]
MSPTKIVIIGQGYVGLPLAKEACAAGLSVVGLDLNRKTVDALNAGRSHVDDLSDQDIATMLTQGYRATADASAIAEADVVIICVPTPLNADGSSPDLGPVEGAMKSIAAHLKKGALVVLESTTYPGTTDTLVKGILDERGLRIDEDYFLAFSPERIDPGNPTFGLRNTPKIVGGVSSESGRRAAEFYSSLVDTVVQARGAREAETAKLLENTYRHVNIALVNEMARFCHELGIDIWDVIDAAKTKPFGFQAFYPGPGVGGHCIPIDPNYLSYEVKRSLGYPFRFVELAQEINSSMPRYTVDRIQALLNDESKAVKGSSVLLLGVTYKADIADQRESPAIPVAEELRNRGADVRFHDPKIAEWRLPSGSLERVADLEQALATSDIVVLLQKHSEYDLARLSDKSAVFFDTRGATRTSSARRL